MKCKLALWMAMLVCQLIGQSTTLVLTEIQATIGWIAIKLVYERAVAFSKSQV